MANLIKVSPKEFVEKLKAMSLIDAIGSNEMPTSHFEDLLQEIEVTTDEDFLKLGITTKKSTGEEVYVLNRFVEQLDTWTKRKAKREKAKKNTKPINAFIQDLADEYKKYIPQPMDTFVETKEYALIKDIVNSGMFYPTYIYGHSGIGKTTNIEQACAYLNRPFFRIQITPETTDEDLIGGFRLVNGETVWQDGPIVMAYRAGGIIVLDEVDLNPRLMILQGILENKPFYIKQTNELVMPAKGFQVFATGNTRGDGSSYRYVGTTSLNEAFLERFATQFEQDFLSIDEERKFIEKYCQIEDIELDNTDVEDLLKFVEKTRQNFVQSNFEGSYVSTRRIGFILKTFKLFGDLDKAVHYGIQRFPESDREAFSMFWGSFR